MSDMIPQAGETTAEHVHESYELKVGIVIKVGIAVALISLAAIFGMRLLLGNFKERIERQREGRPARLDDESGQYAGPNLQENPARDRPDLRADELRRLTTYELVKDKGIARVPIDRAIDVLVEKGLPTREVSAPRAKGAP